MKREVQAWFGHTEQKQAPAPGAKAATRGEAADAAAAAAERVGGTAGAPAPTVARWEFCKSVEGDTFHLDPDNPDFALDFERLIKALTPYAADGKLDLVAFRKGTEALMAEIKTMRGKAVVL